jgi:alkanesulfonate monooxygenase SsuD/methylene tetrahydromethanopterin reductase-like flavin-dependent oxidoreductase (luciferase family)
MRFGVMDHVDDNGLPPAEQYEQRLGLVAAMDRLGFYSYHVAEHHGTSLGLSPSPSVYLSAVAQRTSRLRFGPMVFVVPLYHPMRLAEEICMLDQLSRGRLQLGIGRGAVPAEHEIYGVDPATVAERYAEARDIVLQALAAENVNFDGKYYRVRDFPMVLKPWQRPRPPLWYGISHAESAVWAAAEAANVISLQPAEIARGILDHYRGAWARLGRSEADLPFIGLARHVVVADTDLEARAIARATYPRWQRSFAALWNRSGAPVPANRPEKWDELQERALGIAGSPQTVRSYLAAQCAAARANFFLCQLVFGEISYQDALRSLTLFATEVAPGVAMA